MEHIDKSHTVIIYSIYQGGKPNAWEIAEFLSCHQNKKIVFIDLLEFLPCFSIEPHQETEFSSYLNSIIEKNNLKVEYWNSSHSNRDHVFFENYNIELKNWPAFLMYLTRCDIEAARQSYQKSTPLQNTISKLAICLCGKPRPHRCMLIDKIHGRGLHEYMHLSWLIRENKGCYNFQHFDNQQLVLDYDPGPDPPTHKICVPELIIPPQTQDALFALVAETAVDHMDISEKTFMYIEAKQPFVIFGAPGIHRILKRYYGFKLYEDHIDYSFDYIRDDGLRADHILDQLQKYQYKDYAAVKQEMSEITEHNYQLYMDIIDSGDFVPEHVRNNSYISDIHHHDDSIYLYNFLHRTLFDKS